MDVVTANLYESLDSDIYMKVPDGIFCSKYSRKLQHVLCKTCQVFIWLETIRKNVVQLIERVPPKQMLL
jgi:hypothetical protein